jgi:biopolymer transport protein ExbD
MPTISARKNGLWASGLAGLVLAAGVGTATPVLAVDTKPRPPGKATLKACRAKTANLSKWLTGYASGVDRQPDFIALPEAVELVSVDRPTTAVDAAVVVVLSPDGTLVEGEALAGSSDVLGERLRSALARQQTLAKLTHQTLAQTLLLAVDRRVPWRRVVEAVDAATAAGVESVRLAFRSTRVPRLPAPGPSAFDRRLEVIRQAKDPSERSEGISNMASALVSDCAPLQGPLTSMAKRGGLVPQAFADAILACSCAGDVASLKTLIWALRPPPPGALLTLTLPRHASEGTPLAADGNLAWAAAHQLILKAASEDSARPVRLEVHASR